MKPLLYFFHMTFSVATIFYCSCLQHSSVDQWIHQEPKNKKKRKRKVAVLRIWTHYSPSYQQFLNKCFDENLVFFLFFCWLNVFPKLSHIVPLWTFSIPALYPDPILPNLTVPPRVPSQLQDKPLPSRATACSRWAVMPHGPLHCL